MTRTFNFEIRKKDWLISIATVLLLSKPVALAYTYAKPLLVIFGVAIVWGIIWQFKKELKNEKNKSLHGIQ